MPNKPTIESGLPSDEHRELIFNPEVFSLDKTTVQFFGVDHRLQNFKENEKNIKDIVGASKIVALECAPRALGLYSEQSRKELAKYLEIIPLESMLQVSEIMQLAKKKGLEQISSYGQAADLIIEESPNLKFYAAVEEECLKAGKTILVTDPDMSGSITDIIKNNPQKALIKYSELEAKKFYGITALLSLGVGSLFTEKLLKAFKSTYKNAKTPGEKEQSGEEQTFSSEGGFSRREVIAGGAFLVGAAGIAASRAASNVEVRSLRFNDTANRGRANNPLGEFLVHYEDYRDVALAEALKRVGSRAKDPQILSVFYGEFHRAAAAYYAKHDMERRAKLSFYQTFDREAFPVPKLRMFKPVNGQWEKDVETDLT